MEYREQKCIMWFRGYLEFMGQFLQFYVNGQFYLNCKYLLSIMLVFEDQKLNIGNIEVNIGNDFWFKYFIQCSLNYRNIENLL